MAQHIVVCDYDPRWSGEFDRESALIRAILGDNERTHQIHIFHESNRHDIERHLAVRDYLRAHPSVRDEYAALKRELAAKHPYDIDGYCDGKETFVQRMEADALKWKRG